MTATLTFLGDVAGLSAGLRAMRRSYRFDEGDGGLPVQVEQRPGPLSVERADGRASIRFERRVHFFRGLGLLLEHLDDPGDVRLEETPRFDSVGAMADVSQGNAVYREETLRELLVRMACMGLDRLMVYAEDNYAVEGEPYFGYMRGRYAQEQLRALDDFADALGIELVPCIQTLAHLIDALKWKRFADLKEDDDTLLVGEPSTYAFIERLIRAASAPFRSRRIHLGMDEAWKLGQGNYLLKHGYRSRQEIMQEHLEQVLAIVRRLGLSPMIWSDMFFRSVSTGVTHYDVAEGELERIRARIPAGLDLVYWDYYHKDEAFYGTWIRRHAAAGRTPLFAGGIWSWNGYAVDYRMTFDTTIPALSACAREGVREVLATIWGDGGTESLLFSNLLGLQLFAELAYAPAYDEAKLAARFRFCCEGELADWQALSELDRTPGTEAPPTNSQNPSHYLLWQHPMMGLFDRNAEGLGYPAHYAGLAERLAAAEDRNGAYGYVFGHLAALARVLALKAGLGLDLVAAYEARDRARLAALRDETIPEVAFRVEALRERHRRLWLRQCLPFGWEIHDLRYGALQNALDTTRLRLGDWLAGDVERLEELEEERLPFDGIEGPTLVLRYSRMPSASRISFSTGF